MINLILWPRTPSKYEDKLLFSRASNFFDLLAPRTSNFSRRVSSTATHHLKSSTIFFQYRAHKYRCLVYRTVWYGVSIVRGQWKIHVMLNVMRCAQHMVLFAIWLIKCQIWPLCYVSVNGWLHSNYEMTAAQNDKVRVSLSRCVDGWFNDCCGNFPAVFFS